MARSASHGATLSTNKWREPSAWYVFCILLEENVGQCEQAITHCMLSLTLRKSYSFLRPCYLIFCRQSAARRLHGRAFCSIIAVAFAMAHQVDQNQDKIGVLWEERFPSCSSDYSRIELAVSQPVDGSRLWIDLNSVVHRTYPAHGLKTWTDDEQRLMLAVTVNSEAWPDGAVVQLFVNTVPVTGFIEAASQSLVFTAYELGEYTVSAALYLPGGGKILSCANSTFISSRHLEHIFPSSIGFSAEEPWSGEEIPSSMGDVARWETEVEDFDAADPADSPLGFLASRWRRAANGTCTEGTPDGDGESAARASLREYSAAHARAMRDTASARQSTFLIFRPYPSSGIGNHLLGLVRTVSPDASSSRNIDSRFCLANLRSSMPSQIHPIILSSQTAMLSGSLHFVPMRGRSRGGTATRAAGAGGPPIRNAQPRAPTVRSG
jgi:hypothetical protein